MHVTMLPPLTLKKNVIATFNNFLYVVDLAAAMEVLSSHGILKCVTSSSNSLNENSPLTAYMCGVLPLGAEDSEIPSDKLSSSIA